MASGTKIRTLTRLLDASDAPVWAIGPAGKIVYLSAAAAAWLGLDADLLLDRISVAAAPVSQDPLDGLAASLSAPPGLRERGTASLRVQPPAIEGKRIDPLEVRFVRVGRGTDGWTIAIGGEFRDRIVDTELHDAVAVRQQLDTWRKRHTRIATIATAGVSASARRVRARLQVAAATRTHVGFFAPPGSGTESIAARIHQLSAPGEPLVTVDGPLMDAELLDATLMPVINQLAESPDARGTALVRGLDEMPIDAQQRMAEILASYSQRLRLLALCGTGPGILGEPMEETGSEADLAEESSRGIIDRLIDVLSSLTVRCQPLASRVEDIPLLASAVVDARHAAGEGIAERLSRGALDALVVYPWPRNFEELDRSMAHAVRTAQRPAIAVEHLPLVIRSYRVSDGSQSKATAVSLDDAMRRYELRLIHEAVEASEGNRAEAARRLGISRSRLLRRIDETGKP